MSRIGRALIEILLKGNEQANAQIKATKKELEGLKTAGSGSGSGIGQISVQTDKAAGSLHRLGEAGAAAGAATSLSMAASAGAIAAAGAVAFRTGNAIYGVFDRLANRAEDSRAEWDKLNASINSFTQSTLMKHSEFGPQTRAAKQITQVYEEAFSEISKLSKETTDSLGGNLATFWRSLANLPGSPVRGLFEGNSAFFENFQRKSNQAGDVARRAKDDIEREDEKRAADKAEKEAGREREAAKRRTATDLREIDRLTIARLDGIAKINAEEKRFNEEIAAREAATTDSDELDVLERKKAAGKAYYESERAEFQRSEAEKAAREKERLEERLKREKDAADRLAQHLRDQMEHAADGFAARLAGATRDFQNAQRAASNASIDQLVATVQSLRSLVDARLTANGLNTTQNDYGPYSGG